MRKCEYLKWEFEVDGSSIIRCIASPERCPRKRGKPPEGKVSPTCWRVE